MQILINGKSTSVTDKTTILTIMQERKLSNGRAVVELNEMIVDKTAWSTTFFKENDTLEIVTFMGGGSK
ncbi:sulfur carrier protein ThiS [Pectinatus frisingensis]|uniref:sulfur carrier protein ThiS n=1 Tax=Pectinatus frisingensis TaxID=865 RepID=UPI0015F6457A|nr:sulfur carrier protein ThiS [Pectinatus frisingensis]